MIGLIRHLSQYVSRDVLDQMYKLYVRPHLDYGDIVYHKYDPDLSSVITKRLEQTQYQTSFAVTGAWRGRPSILIVYLNGINLSLN